jgi:hypothetical protein
MNSNFFPTNNVVGVGFFTESESLMDSIRELSDDELDLAGGCGGCGCGGGGSSKHKSSKKKSSKKGSGGGGCGGGWHWGWGC